MKNKQDWRDRICGGCKKVDKSYCYPCSAIRITEAEIAAAVAKERERVVDMISHIRSRNHVCPDCSELCHCYTVCDEMNIEYALKNYEEGK